MSYEINIIAINQKEPICYHKRKRILVHNEITDSEVNRYFEIWPFFSNTPGILYSLVEELEEGFFSAVKLCDSDFEIALPQTTFPAWLSVDDRENLTPFLIVDSAYVEFIEIIQFILNSSPQKRVLFHTRYQCSDREIVFGVLKLNKFKEMLVHKQILFNVCYILESD